MPFTNCLQRKNLKNLLNLVQSFSFDNEPVISHEKTDEFLGGKSANDSIHSFYPFRISKASLLRDYLVCRVQIFRDSSLFSTLFSAD